MQDVKKFFKNTHLDVIIYWISLATLWNSTTVTTLTWGSMAPVYQFFPLWSRFVRRSFVHCAWKVTRRGLKNTRLLIILAVKFISENQCILGQVQKISSNLPLFLILGSFFTFSSIEIKFSENWFLLNMMVVKISIFHQLIFCFLLNVLYWNQFLEFSQEVLVFASCLKPPISSGGWSSKYFTNH